MNIKKMFKQPKRVQAQTDVKVDYLISDPRNYDFRKQISPPKQQSMLRYRVRGYQGGGYEIDTTPGRAATVYCSVTNALNWVNNYIILKQWAGTQQLRIIPEAGRDFNAYYDRNSIKLFRAPHPKHPKSMVYTCNSSDIVTHELGHGILDSIRPEMWNAASLEVWSYHEAFADSIAMISMLHHPEVLELLISKKNINQPNIVNNLAEQMGRCIYLLTNGEGCDPSCLRSAHNQFVYSPPELLPESASYKQLAAECHSFGRLFAGVLYDLFLGFYQHAITKKSLNQLDSLIYARDHFARYLLLASKNAPLNVHFYQSVGKTLIWVAANEPYKPHYGMVVNVLKKRKIVRASLTATETKSAPVCDTPTGIKTVSNTRTIRLSDHLRPQPGLSHLYDLELEVPQENGYLYDQNNKQLIHSMTITEYETIRSAERFITYLHKTNNIGNDDSTPFEISNGKLIRTHFS